MIGPNEIAELVRKEADLLPGLEVLEISDEPIELMNLLKLRYARPSQWKYEDYSSWSKTLAQAYTRKELEKEFYAADSARSRLAISHLRAVEDAHSIDSQSQRRAQSRNAMVGNYERYTAYKNALEIYDHFPQHTLEGGIPCSGYDRIVFTSLVKNDGIVNVKHAYGLMKDGGKLVAMMCVRTCFGRSWPARKFQEWLSSVDGRSFKPMPGAPAHIVVIGDTEASSRQVETLDVACSA